MAKIQKIVCLVMLYLTSENFEKAFCEICQQDPLGVRQLDYMNLGVPFKWSAEIKTLQPDGVIMANAWPVADEIGCFCLHWKNMRNAQGKMLFLKGGKLRFDIGWVGQKEAAGPAINDNDWHIVGIRYADGAYILTVDGNRFAYKWTREIVPDDTRHTTAIGYQIGHQQCGNDMGKLFDGQIRHVIYAPSTELSTTSSTTTKPTTTTTTTTPTTTTTTPTTTTPSTTTTSTTMSTTTKSTTSTTTSTTARPTTIRTTLPSTTTAVTTTVTPTTRSTTEASTTTPTIKTSTTQSLDNWLPWSQWSTCNRVCRGQRARSRLCVDRRSCGGRQLEQEECNAKPKHCNLIDIVSVNESLLSCDEFCLDKGLLCDPLMQTGSVTKLFQRLHYQCFKNVTFKDWTVSYAPYYDHNNSLCVGYDNIPVMLNCSARPPRHGLTRLCKCVAMDDLNMIEWSPWNECSATCGGGKQHRKRHCTISSLKPCSKHLKEERKCNENVKCSVHGGFSSWESWSVCDHSCGGGNRTRIRKCNDPKPQDGGTSCVGLFSQMQTCGVTQCPVHGSWSSWSEFSGCNKPCNNGSMVKRRFCTNPKPLFGGTLCNGEDVIKKTCNTHTCPDVTVNVACKFDLVFNNALNIYRSIAWSELQLHIFQQEKGTSQDVDVKNQLVMSLDTNSFAIRRVKLNSAKKGSIIVNFDIEFKELSSYALVYLQDSLQYEASIGKIPTIINNQTKISENDTLPSAPFNVSALIKDSTSIFVFWNHTTNIDTQNDDTTGYLIFYRVKLKNSEKYEVLGSRNASVKIIGLQPATVYQIRVCAFNSKGNGIPSELVFAMTQETEPSTPPTDVVAYPLSHESISVQWTGVKRDDMNGEPVGYRVYYRNNNQENIVMVNFTESLLVISGLYPTTTYVVKVCAYNVVGQGPCQLTQTVTFESVPTYAPMNLRPISRTHNTITVRWNFIVATPEPLSGYHIRYFALSTGGILLYNTAVQSLRVAIGVRSVRLRFLQSNTKYRVVVQAFNQYGDGIQTRIDLETCKCPEHISTNYYMFPPYISRVSSTQDDQLTGVFPAVLKDLVENVCGICEHRSDSQMTVLNLTSNGKNNFASKANIYRVIDDIDEFTEVSFPLTMNPAKDVTDTSDLPDQMFESEFFPLVAYPGALLIVKEDSMQRIVMKRIQDLLNVWPILFLNISFAIISGACIWFMEAWSNPLNQDFSQSAIIGFQQGWYYAYITQITIGYGDLVPKGICSRCFVILWIVVSIIMQALLVGAMTTALTSASTSNFNTIYGETVGAISGSFEERLVILRNGKISKDRSYKTLEELITGLDNGMFNAILIDAYMASDKMEVLVRHSDLYRIDDLIHYPRYYGFVATGVMANLKPNIDGYLTANQQKITEMIQNFTKEIPKASPYKSVDLFAIESGYLANAVKILLPILIVAIGIGHVVSWLGSVKRKKTITPKLEDSLDSLQSDLNCMQTMTTDFQLSFKEKVSKLSEKIDKERVLLYFDRGESSLFPDAQFRLYQRSLDVHDLLINFDKTYDEKRKNSYPPLRHFEMGSCEWNHRKFESMV